VTTLGHDVKILLTVERCFDCGSLWATEQGKRGTCPHCAQDRINRAVGNQNAIERKLKAQKAATSRAARRRR
jgi:predicted Zn-ribbon and HTH transcriptional regulator